MKDDTGACRERILAVASRLFAERGYSGTSLQDIVSEANLTKPTLYYYFKSKEGLFVSLMEQAYEQRLQHMQAAVARTQGFEAQLTEMLTAVFNFFHKHRDLSRLSFASAFAAKDEMPSSPEMDRKRRQNFDFVHELVKQGLAEGALDDRLNSRELTYGIYGALCFHIMANLLLPGTRLNRTTAKRIVTLFLDGARKP